MCIFASDWLEAMMVKPIVSLLNRECENCSLNAYCMNGVGVRIFRQQETTIKWTLLPAAEKEAIKAVSHVIAYTSDNDICFPGHLAGAPLLSIMGKALQ